jgi:DNA (cytosine-5)-methyltransferase 1
LKRYRQGDFFRGADEVIEELHLPSSSDQNHRTMATTAPAPPAILDLFTGMGGMAAGFEKVGFTVTGVDQVRWSKDIFEGNNVGEIIIADLAATDVYLDVPVVTGGPPCTPWSAINQQLRGDEHPDQPLLDRFFTHVEAIRPEVFLMENVPILQSDPTYQVWWKRMEQSGYSLGCDVFCYAHYGAATRRQRLFTIGVRRSRTGALEFMQRMRMMRQPPRTVGDEIAHLRFVRAGDAPDHVWPALTTISSYADKYATGQYGWRRLSFDEPAPSFGNVTKTYVLHPDSDPVDTDARVLSVRELLLIMGFHTDFRFPDRMPLAAKYQMLADCISPVFSRCCASVIHEMLWGENPK